MIFRRRDPRPWSVVLREVVAPRKHWRRGFAYIGKRVQRLGDTPHRVALGCACGVMASFSPFFGLHLFVGALFAWVVGGNVIASAVGQIFGNWLTFPLIAATSLELGGFILGRPTVIDDFDPAALFTDPGYFFEAVFWPYLIGGLGPGVAFSVAFYYLIRPLVAAYQRRRREKLGARAAALVASRAAAP